MHIVVLLKQVPDTTAVEVDPRTGVLRRDGVDSKLNPYDLFALEEALRLREALGGRVTALTMGPPQAQAALGEAIWMGADEGVLLSDRCFAGADVLATATALAAALRVIARGPAGPAGLILCGRQTTDGDTAQVGPETAALLGLAHAVNVCEIAVEEGRARVRVRLDEVEQVLSLPLPCLLAVDKDANTPRLPSYRRRLSGEGALRTLSLADLDDPDPARYGLNGSPTQVERIFPPEVRSERRVLHGDADTLGEALFGILRDRKFI